MSKSNFWVCCCCYCCCKILSFFFCISICLINLLREKKKYTKQPKMCNSFDRIPHTHSHRIAQGRERDYYCKALKQNKRKEEKKKQQQKRGALIWFSFVLKEKINLFSPFLLSISFRFNYKNKKEEEKLALKHASMCFFFVYLNSSYFPKYENGDELNKKTLKECDDSF